MISQILISMRPKQWIKNLFVFAPLLFALQLASAESWVLAGIAALCFVLLSSAVYLFNDITDRAEDKKHPAKRKRPIASGKLPVRLAMFSAIVCLAGVVLLLIYLPVPAREVLLAYLAMNILYSLYLKRIAIVDVMIIASGFVLRVLAGGYAINVAVSPWIILTTFLLALFLGFAKRRHELEHIASKRVSLNGYNKALLDKFINISSATVLLCYAIYSVGMAESTGNMGWVLSCLFVAFGIFRYLQGVYVHQKGGEPENVFYTDLVFVLNGVLWLLVILYSLLK